MGDRAGRRSRVAQSDLAGESPAPPPDDRITNMRYLAALLLVSLPLPSQAAKLLNGNLDNWEAI